MEKGLENAFIDQALKRMNTKYFLGVYPSDKIPFSSIKQQPREKKVIIVNLDPSTEKGSHFVTLIFKKNKTMVYNDSFNMPLEWTDVLYEQLRKNMSGYDVVLKNNQYAVQDQSSSFCGFYALQRAMLEDPSFAKVKISPFSKMKKNTNDKLVVDNIVKMIKNRKC